MKVKKILFFNDLKKISFWCLLFMLITNSNIVARQTIGIKETLCNLLLSPIATSSNNQEITIKTDGFAQQLEPKAKVRVKNLNALGRLLVGYKNTISIPFINYILVNEKWLETLTPKAQDFIIARSLMYLLAHPYEYTLFKYVYPLLLYNLFMLVNEKYQTIPSSLSIQPLTMLLLKLIINLIPSYCLRKIEYKIDAQAAVGFDCFDGAFAALLDSTKFSHDGSMIDKVNSKISLIYLLNILTRIAHQIHYRAGQQNTGIFGRLIAIYHRLETPLKVDEIRFPLSWIWSPDYLIPGIFTDRSSAFVHFIKNLPLVNLFFNYPRPYTRIKELTELRKQLLREKFKEEKNKAK